MIRLLRRGYDILRDEGWIPFLRKSFAFARDGPKTYVGRIFDRLYPRLPPTVVTYHFELRSRRRTDVSDANPARPVWVDPQQIDHYQGSGPKEFGLVADGDWDDPECRFNEHPVYRSISSRYGDGVDWTDTELYERYRERIRKGNPYWRCTTREELECYFESIDRLYEAISENGYKSQRELLAEDPVSVRRRNTDAPHPVLQEIGVNVHRDGTLAKKGAGFHRLALARVIGVRRVPVTVRVRHAEWQSIRDEIRRTSSPEGLSSRARERLDHPDLNGIVPDSWQ